MAIVQISKIQQRSGNLVDLPQLDEAELGWATDAKRLFIGKTVPNENIEVLTSYSNISFSQLNGAVGNLNISAVTAENGQVLTYDGTNWVNRGATSGGLINLGTASNVKIGGGSTGYVLETDGTGNLSWTPKTAVVANITNVTKANPGVVTTQTDSYFTNGSLVTITDVNGMTQLNGNSYYAKILTSNTFALYSDSGLATTVDTSGYGSYTSNGRAISSITGTGSGAAGGSNTSVQFNNAGVLDGSSSVTWNLATNLFSINGNANVGNLNANGIVTSSRFTSNVATGTAPFTVTSTTQVANLNVATAGTAGTAGTVTTAAQPNITSVGTLTGLTLTAVTGTLSVPIITTGANTTAGTLTGNWSLSTGSKLQATYADLAEYYTSDLDYPPGTVVEFGGYAEVTLASDATTRVAGVVSTDPAYAMNSKCAGDYVVALALQGRVPCKVRGSIRKGDMMISGGNGYARPSSNPAVGTIIGKALENFSGTEGVIEVAVGRL